MIRIEDFAHSLPPSDSATVQRVCDYVAWRTPSNPESFTPAAHEDIPIRTYLLHLRTHGTDREEIHNRLAALRQFYAWAQTKGEIHYNPFTEFDFERPILTHEQVQRRREVLGSSPTERELARLRGLVRVSEHLNRTADVRTLISGALETLVEVLALHSAWAFLSAESGLEKLSAGDSPHDFILAGAHNLPPALEREEREHLKCPPDCHCQSFFRSKNLHHAVNVVECTRLQGAVEAGGEAHGLIFHATVPLVAGDNYLGLINVATNEYQLLTAHDLEFLTSVGGEVAAALERARLYDLAETQRAQLERELQVAHQVQASLLPRELPDVAGFHFASDWRSAREVAGDFYDIFPLHDGHWAFVVGDVSDKGAPAALYMAMTRALLRSIAPHHRNPANALMQLNERITTQSSYTSFVTMFYAILDPESGALTYANAGHNPPVLKRQNGEHALLMRTGRVVGAFDKLHMDEQQIRLARGDALVIYTDGVTDALDPSGRDYGMERLVPAALAGPDTAPDLLAHLERDLASFTQMAPQPDDITYFVVSRDA